MGAHKDSLGLEADSHLEHHRTEEPETDTLVVHKVAGHTIAGHTVAGRNLGTDRDAALDEGWETELRSSEAVGCRDSTWLICGRRSTG